MNTKSNTRKNKRDKTLRVVIPVSLDKFKFFFCLVLSFNSFGQLKLDSTRCKNNLFGQTILTKYNCPLALHNREISFLEIKYGPVGQVMSILTLSDSIVCKGVPTTLFVDKVRSNDSALVTIGVINWYSNVHGNKDISEKEEALVFDYFDNYKIDKTENKTEKCFDFPSVYLCVYRKNLFSRTYKCIKSEKLLKCWW